MAGSPAPFRERPPVSCARTVNDQHADDTTGAASSRAPFARIAGVATITRTAEASIVRIRRRIPGTPPQADRMRVRQGPIPAPLRFLGPRGMETRRMHAREECGPMHVKLQEHSARHRAGATSRADPAPVDGRRAFDPSPIPRRDPAVRNAALRIDPGGCVTLLGAPVAGRVTRPRLHQGDCAKAGGSPIPGGLAPAAAPARAVSLRRHYALGSVTQILRAVPRAPAPDEPTASFDPIDRAAILALVDGGKARGAAILGIVPDAAAGDTVADPVVDVSAFAP